MSERRTIPDEFIEADLTDTISRHSKLLQALADNDRKMMAASLARLNEAHKRATTP